MRRGEPMPERIATAPRVKFGTYIYLQAFFDLDTERTHGMGYARIPVSAMRAYAKEHSFDEYQTEMLIYVVKAMDNANMERVNNETKAKAD